jgi:hypothetical protein
VKEPRRRLATRRLRRESDGTLFELDEHRRIELGELADDVRSGRYFRAARHSSGQDCTHEVLAQVLATGIGEPGAAFAPVTDWMGKALGQLAGGAVGRLLDGDSTEEKARTRPKRRSRTALTKPEWLEER